MRTTITLELEAYRLARAIASQKNESVGKVLGDALIKTYRPDDDKPLGFSVDASGWPRIRIGRVITPEDVAAAIEED